MKVAGTAKQWGLMSLELQLEILLVLKMVELSESVLLDLRMDVPMVSLLENV